MKIHFLLSNFAMSLGVVLSACSKDVENHNPGAKPLFANDGTLYPGSWSDDGALFYATSHEGDAWNILEIDPQTGTAHALEIDLPGAGVSDHLGKFLLIESVEPGDSEIYLYDVGTKSLQQLTDNDTYEWHPSFFPGGDRIVFDSPRNDQLDLFVLDIQSGETQNLTNNAEPEQVGKVSRDGNMMAFHRGVAGEEGRYDIVLRDLASGDETLLVSNPADDSYPVWSRDGAHIIFSSNKAGNFDLYAICVNGAQVIQMTDDSANEKYPKWSPDGARIVYQSDASGRPSLYIMETPALPDCGWH